ncbi:hypothetical protein GCM10022419_036140 [Nonomuraea rosea]|uniref:Metalloprotease-like protein n=1 Tax=Nonomuraea rosea TaxID=638574 RepID=A0ABP6WKG8_9ACTN
MRLPAVLAAVLVTLLLAGNTAAAHASAYPIRDRVLTVNKLYRSGKLQPTQCPERAIEPHDVALAKRYLTAVLNCLNASWGAHFKRAGLPFAKARIGFITKPRRYCKAAWDDAAARYCASEKRFLVLLDDDLLEDTADLFLFRLAAHEYGHHLQNITGMYRAFAWHPYKGKSEMNEQLRRNELQAECLGGVFIGSVWDSIDRITDDWRELLDINRRSGDEYHKAHDHGKGRNIAAWLDKGFRASSPAACNTWVSPSSKVS